MDPCALRNNTSSDQLRLKIIFLKFVNKPPIKWFTPPSGKFSSETQNFFEPLYRPHESYKVVKVSE